MSEEVYDRAIVDNMLPPPAKIYFPCLRRYTSFAHGDILKCQSKYYCVCTHSEHMRGVPASVPAFPYVIKVVSPLPPATWMEVP